MYVINVTDVYNNITLDIYIDILNDYNYIAHNNYTNEINDYEDMTLSNRTNNVDIIIPTILFTIPCGLSFLCLKSLMVCTVIKPLFYNK